MRIENAAKRLTLIAIAFLCTALLAKHVLAAQFETKNMSRGAYIARIADCITCHTNKSKTAPYAGGLALNSPFGIIYSTNITPDPDYGIGNYTLSEFSRAVRNGIAKDDRRLYPAMPYPSFTAISDEDIGALYDYFMHEVAPVSQKSPETELPFPFSIRNSLILWDFVFVKQRRFEAQTDRDTLWNRGAYLVQSLGHCGACHTPRGLVFQETAYSEASSSFLSGAVVDNWFSANLRGDKYTGLGLWSETDIASFLATGHGQQFSAFGSMLNVIENSTQYFNASDLSAIAHYLKSLPPRGENNTYAPDKPAIASEYKALLSGEIEPPGAGLYQAFCARCHQLTGSGEQAKYPKLAGNPVVLSEKTTSLIRLLLEGSETAHTKLGEKPYKMPDFAKQFTDQQIAEVLTFIRNNWGNKAAPVTTRDVLLLR